MVKATKCLLFVFVKEIHASVDEGVCAFWLVVPLYEKGVWGIGWFFCCW